MQGLLLVDKPPDWTSFDAVNYVRRVVAEAEGKKPRQVKVGHTGTLDPFATGLLVLLVGKDYTRRAAELSKLDKTYEVTMKLGETSTTGDPEGEISAVSAKIPTKAEVQAALAGFEGEIQQVPPAYSAIKIDGRRAYQLARAGQEVVIQPRKIKINSLKLTAYDYPEVKFTADVASGTYIRTLAEDIGQAVRTGAYTTALRRTRVGDYQVAGAAAPKSLSSSNILPSLKTL